MDAGTFAKYLEKRYDGQLDYYEKAARKYMNQYRNFQWALIILSTITTFLAALPRSDNFDLHIAIVVSAALVTILSTALKTFQYQELWVGYRTTIEQLRPEIYYYQMSVGEYSMEGIDKEALFVERVEGILNKERDAWHSQKKPRNPELKQEQPNKESAKKGDEPPVK